MNTRFLILISCFLFLISYIYPKEYDVFIEKGDERFKNRNFSEAIFSYKQAVEFVNDKKKGSLYSKIGDCFVELKEYKLAIDFYNLSIKFNREDKDAYIKLGNMYWKIGASENAIKIYEKLLEIDRYDVLGHLKLAEIYYTQGLYNLAEINYRDVITINKDNEEAIIGLVNISERKKDYDEAIKNLNMLISKRENPPSDYYLKIGSIYLYKNDYDKALLNFENADKINPNNEEIQMNIGFAYFKEKKYEKAEKYLKWENPYAHFLLGMIYFKKGETKKAIDNLKISINLTKDETIKKYTEHILKKIGAH